MLEPITKEIDGITFQFTPMDPLTALDLDREVNTLLMPLLGGLDVGDGTGDAINLEVMVRGLAGALKSHDRASYTRLFKDMFASVQVVVPGKGAHDLNSPVGMSVFHGQIMLMYKVFFEVMRYNKFLPFALSQLGPAMGKMLATFAPKLGQMIPGGQSVAQAS